MCPLYLLPGALPLDVSLACTSSLGLYPWMYPLYLLLGALPLDLVPCSSFPGLYPWICPLYLLPGALPLDVSLVPPPRGLYPWMCPLYLLPGALPLDVPLVVSVRRSNVLTSYDAVAFVATLLVIPIFLACNVGVFGRRSKARISVGR